MTKREILFRGKRVDNGKWVIGNRLFDNVSGKHYIVPFGNITESDKIGQEGCCYCVGFEVIPETIGEFTGLTDKNGNKIFEGDIVDFFNICGKIVNECGAFGIAVLPNIDYCLLESKIPFNNNANFCFNDNFISLWELWWNYEQDDNPLYEVEVIGNIYDNPELLEVSE